MRQTCLEDKNITSASTATGESFAKKTANLSPARYASVRATKFLKAFDD
jgi:hypothetical protein